MYVHACTHTHVHTRTTYILSCALQNGSFRCVRKCEGHEDAVRVVAVSGSLVFSGSYDGTIGVW